MKAYGQKRMCGRWTFMKKPNGRITSTLVVNKRLERKLNNVKCWLYL
jgi:hypothetical protein